MLATFVVVPKPEKECHSINLIINSCDYQYVVIISMLWLPVCCYNLYVCCDYQVCVPGFYGWMCSSKCSRHCVNGECHHINGTCLQGCNSGWKGDKCAEPGTVV